MAEKKTKFNIGNVLIVAGVGFGGNILMEKLDEKVEWFGNNPWASGTAVAILGAGLEYFTNGKYPQISYPLIAIGAAKAGKQVMDSMNGFSYADAGSKQQQMQGLLDDIKKYREIEMKMMGSNNAPAGNVMQLPNQNPYPYKSAC